jgi:putative ABC transport system ATP-binding protein
VMALFDELHNQGLTVIMVTHDPVVAQHAHRIITLSDGEIVSDKPNGHTLVVPVIRGADHESH